MSIVWPGAEPGPWFTPRPRRRRRRPDATRHACRQGRPAAKGCAWVSVSPEVHTGEPARRASLRPVGPASAEATTCFDTLAGMPSAPDLRVLVVLPAWNEAASLPAVLNEIHSQLPDVAVVVVNDGSADATSAVARAHGAQVLDLPFNIGVGGAMRAGFRFALANDFDAVVQVDADGQHDPRDVPALLAQLADADIVIGARFAERGKHDVRGPDARNPDVVSVSLVRAIRLSTPASTRMAHRRGPRAIRMF